MLFLLRIFAEQVNGEFFKDSDKYANKSNEELIKYYLPQKTCILVT